MQLLDKFNSLCEDSQNESDEEKEVYKLFKTCSWFVFEMLDLHPFGDGNGRLCQLLCGYVLSTPIHNILELILQMTIGVIIIIVIKICSAHISTLGCSRCGNKVKTL